jgi:hypothetical protein
VNLFLEEPLPLTKRQRVVLIVLSILVAATRIWGRSKSLWDWDEALFATALTRYDVAGHLPHPPGFPTYVALGKLIFLFTGNAFRSLQAINIIAACSLFTLAVMLGRELRLRFESAIAAGLILCFAGNVWVFGGTAFSDVPALALLLTSYLLLLRGCRSPRAFMIGSVMTGLMLTIRPQLLMIVALPWLVAAWFAFKRRRLEPLVSFVIIATIVVLAYGSVAAITGFDEYRAVVEGHKRYMVEVDSWKNPARLPLPDVVNRCFIYVTRAGSIDYYVVLFALIALLAAAIRRKWHLLLLFASFLPFILFAFVMLDTNSFGRYSIAYVPVYALLAASGIELFASLFKRLTHGRVVVSSIVTALIAAGMFAWSAPAVAEVRRHNSPPVRAIKWIRKNADPKRDVIFVQGGILPHVRLMLPDYRYQQIAEIDEIAHTGRSFIIVDRRVPVRGAIHFERPKGRLWKIVRRYFFDVTIIPATTLVSFNSGWHQREVSGDDSWRWMKQSGTLILPPLGAPRGRLTLRYSIPSPLLTEPVVVTISHGGKVVDRAERTGEEVVRVIELEADPAKESTLTISTSHVLNPKERGLSPDGRDLGLCLREVAWEPAPEK